MAAGKWIGGILGFMSGGALGALAGVALGALFDYGINAVNKDGEPKTDTEVLLPAVKASAARRVNSNIMRGSATVFCSLCLFWRRILLRQTAR